MPIVAFTALFWTDAWFWDDTLPEGEGVGSRALVDGEPVAVTAWEAGGYTLCRVWSADKVDVRPAIDGPMVRRFGSVETTVTDDGAKLVVTVNPVVLDLEKLNLASIDGGGATIEGSPVDMPPDTATLESLAPFPVTVDLRTGQLHPDVVPLPADAWPIVAGLRVRQGAEEAVVLDAAGAALTLRSVACKRDATFRVENPHDVEVPAGTVALSTLAAALAALLWYNRRGGRDGGQGDPGGAVSGRGGAG